MQRRVTFWRSLLHQLNFSLADLNERLREFLHFAYDSEMTVMTSSRAETPSERLAKETQEMLRNCIEVIDKSYDSLRAEMQIVDSRRSIVEAENISKLTELAFIFIPLSFVASLFSMQVHELDGGVPLYRFVLVAIAFIVAAYTVRLSIRSSRLVEYKNRTFTQIREEAQLQYNESIPTHTFLAWIGTQATKETIKITKKVFAFLWPFLLLLAVLAALLSPIILLWLRGMNRGFTTVITILVLILDAILVYPVVTNLAGEFQIDLGTINREIRESRNLNRTKRAKIRKIRKSHMMKMGVIDPETGSFWDGGTDSSDADEISES
jgi:hypothetical protein